MKNTGIIRKEGGRVHPCLLYTSHFDVQDKEFRLGIRHEYFDCDYLFELEELVNKRIQSFCEKSKNDKIYSPPVADSIKYIREHYCENLSLGKIAQHVHMNTDYLGKLFKKETGVSFNTFITEIKMEYADYLIRNTNLKKYEVSEKLGYTNFSYFSRLYSNYKAQKKL